MTGEPVFECGMICEMVLMGLETKFLSGGDVCGQVVDVECVFWGQRVFLDCVLIDRWLGFDGTDFVGQDGAVEQGEFREIFEYPRGVDGVDVGKQDEAMSGGVEFAGGFPHGWVGSEDVAPGVVEDFGGGVGG